MSFDKRKDFDEAVKQAEAEFSAQYPTAEPEPEVVAPSPEPAPEPEVTPDPVPTEDEKYKAAVRAMNEAQRKAAEAAKREEDYQKREAELQEKLNKALEEARLAMQRTPEPQVEESDELEEDMPEVAKLARKIASREINVVASKLAKMEERLRAEEAERERQSREVQTKTLLSEIKTAHPDYDEVVNSEAMQAWINNEAPPIYKQIYDGSVAFHAKDAIAVLNAFKSTTTPKRQEVATTPSDAEIAAPVKTNPTINPKQKADKPLTAKDMDYFMHNSHRMNPEELAEWDRRLNG